jgi:hypothetical protein
VQSWYCYARPKWEPVVLDLKEGCAFLMWGEVNGKKLTEAHIRQLVIKG